MELEVINYEDLSSDNNLRVVDKIHTALFMTGIIGVRNVPTFIQKSAAYLEAARRFVALNENVKQKYAPNRDAGITEGYEVGAEQFKDQHGNWQTDNKKVSYYAYVPDHESTIWPNELDLKKPYLDLGQLMFTTGNKVLQALNFQENKTLFERGYVGFGRMLHYLNASSNEDTNPNWCGAHLDHGVFTALMPAYYFKGDREVIEPEEAGLYVVPSTKNSFEKVHVIDKSIMLFQVGEFLQLATNDKLRATKHLVRKPNSAIERFAFALFFGAQPDVVIQSDSVLTKDERFMLHATGKQISYALWENASYERYRA
ncbi:MAG: 2-oxoglutarate and iron-dependent oxygenase domain-containing protein [Legionella sp.]|jgi:isopenicillin N synthase-like dioxygenase